ncbi:MAG TPA: Crp/Fnr family transcriptional regulator [Chitinophagaceae bacterium]
MSDEIKYVYLKAHPLFAHFSDPKLKDICNIVKIKTVFRGETIGYGDGNYSKIYFLVKGKIKITESDEADNELVKDILMDGDIFGDLALEGRPSMDENAEALMANTIIACFNVFDFKKLLSDNPAMALQYASRVSGKLKRMEDRHADLVFRDAKARLIRFIKHWARMDGSRVGDKIILNNYLTHSDIAGVISTSRQSVNVFLNELRDSGMLHYNRKRIELNNPVAWN